MSDTIFYKLKLKNSKTPQELFEKFIKFVKPRGITKKWVCDVDEDGKKFELNFNDACGSEIFCIEFDEDNTCQSCCKVFFPLVGEQFEDEKKSEFKILLNMIYSARTFFSQMDITDDYGLCESFLESKKYRIVFRELSDEETERTQQLYNAGHTSIREFIIALLFNLRGLDYSDDYIKHINKNCNFARKLNNAMDEYKSFGNEERVFGAFCDSFLYETSEFCDKGLLRESEGYIENNLNIEMFSVGALVLGINWLTGISKNFRAMDAKSGQALKLYEHSFLPLCETETDDFKKCILAYRYFVSLYDWLGFKYIEKM